MLENIEFLPKKSEFRVSDVKNLAVTTNQKEDIANKYPKIENNTVSNADMLSQSFSSNPTLSNENLKMPAVEPVQITSIPTTQNTNMEEKPVDLNINQNSNNNFNMFASNDNSQLNIPSINEDLNSQTIVENRLQNNVPEIGPINLSNIKDSDIKKENADNSFKVSDQANIFDNPIMSFGINQDEINKPEENNNVIEHVMPEENSKFNNSNKNDLLNDDIILAQIAIEESNVKHYEALAENSKKKIELLKRQVKNNEEVNLENTASNLFNNNGVLDDEKVLGKTPVPFIKAA